jgi:hypothetical protein
MNLSYFNGEKQEKLKGQSDALTSIESISTDDNIKNAFLLNDVDDIKKILHRATDYDLEKYIKWLVDYRSTKFIETLLYDQFEDTDRFQFTIYQLIDNNKTYDKLIMEYGLLKSIYENTKKRMLNYQNPCHPFHSYGRKKKGLWNFF